MDSFHGTSAATATQLASGKVDSNKGGGELGCGFYTGAHLYEAKAWAVHRSGDRRKNVVRFDVPDDKIDTLSLLLLDHQSAVLFRNQVKRNGTTRTHRCNRDMVWAPIVGSERASGDQYKWESAKAEDLLNSSLVSRTII